MHMSDALISPAVGGAMWTATAAVTFYAARKIQRDPDQSKIPLMGVLGAFVFAGQMLNFAIPGTGSSGHLGGGLLLAILLGPWRAFIVMASVLSVQALFFADGGLLSLGANSFNLGFIPAFVAYPLVYKAIVGREATAARIGVGSMAAAVIALLLGALGVIFETSASGVSELPFAAFAALMLPVHLVIGVAEGLITAAVITFVLRAQPSLLEREAVAERPNVSPLPKVLLAFGFIALFAGGVLSWFASTRPDGLEWSIAQITQGKGIGQPVPRDTDHVDGPEVPTSGVAGVAGSVIVLLVVAAVGLLLRALFRGSPRRS